MRQCDGDRVEPVCREVIREALETLPLREWRIVELRYGLSGDTPRTLGEVGAMLGLTLHHARSRCGHHGWWQACAELDLLDYPPLGPASANLNAVLRLRPSDPISGSLPLLASVCQVTLLN